MRAFVGASVCALAGASARAYVCMLACDGAHACVCVTMCVCEGGHVCVRAHERALEGKGCRTHLRMRVNARV